MKFEGELGFHKKHFFSGEWSLKEIPFTGSLKEPPLQAPLYNMDLAPLDLCSPMYWPLGKCGGLKIN